MNNLGNLTYLLQIHQQCEFAIFSYGKMRKAAIINYPINGAKFWYYAQSMLNSAANISKFLWSFDDKDKYSEERKEIRKLLGVKNDSPLKNRKVRNCIEHYDERLLAWAKKIKENEVFTDACIGTESSYNEYSFTPFRYYTKDTNTIYYKKYTFKIDEMLNEIVMIKDKCLKILDGYGLKVNGDYMGSY
ncbi:hypothetical protein [Bacillus cereus]|uniref:Uncharacterized protein n=1 Tax=Bacillus cereus 03BB108 TaxID=451709 RepID=A0AAN0SRK1_BACCE|nr:hypothetical protein [Bacillus cereus]AJI08672.1 hypothetical protein AK40_6204 [Bacillus cereus 03BB108]EDX60204.1 conserved hypothetical protein [Bacillus cereus 03BB108]QKH04540.1 hypothetical protein FOC96_30745 [Bacillus cereus]